MENVSRETLKKPILTDERQLEILREFLTKFHKRDEPVEAAEWAIFTIEDQSKFIDELREQLSEAIAKIEELEKDCHEH